jgi:ornithine carbamoyltransferase
MKKSAKAHESLRQQRPTTKWGQHYTGHDRFADVLKGCSLLSFFDKPSLRTRMALEVGMQQLGGQAIFYSIGDSTLGEKETIEDTGRVVSRMCNGITARVHSRNAVRALASVCSVPVINALDDYAHPTQMLADLLTILEHKGSWEGITMAYFGDLRNNITYDLMRTSALMGFNLHLAGQGPIEESVWEECKTLQTATGTKIEQFETAEEAIKDVDVVYCDTWMSYGTAKEEEEIRTKLFMPYQVTAERMKLAKPDAVFMNCLPASRDMEQTAEVLDGPQSIVFDQAENTLHALKALLTFTMAPARFQRCME